MCGFAVKEATRQVFSEGGGAARGCRPLRLPREKAKSHLNFDQNYLTEYESLKA